MITDIDKIQPGDQIRFIGVKPFWFTNMIENAKVNLVVGNVYTIATKDIASSWVKITLRETGNLEYALSWFDHVL